MFKPKGMIFPSIHCAEAVITVPKSMIYRWSAFIGQHEIIHGYNYTTENQWSLAEWLIV